MTHALLEIDRLTVRFPVRSRSPFQRRTEVTAVDDVSIRVAAGRTLGVIGESGSGKTTLARVAMGLVQPNAGSVRFDGREITGWNPRRRQRDNVAMQIVFQDPQSSLDPRMNARELITEPLLIAGRPRDGVAERLAAQVGLPEDALERTPNAFSGGQRQRIAIARALAGEPRLLVLDEPTSALDLSVQAQILNLLVALQRERGLAFLFISHDLSVIRHQADDVAVMVGGAVVECGPADDVLSRPQHPYTQRLMQNASLASLETLSGAAA